MREGLKQSGLLGPLRDGEGPGTGAVGAYDAAVIDIMLPKGGLTSCKGAVVKAKPSRLYRAPSDGRYRVARFAAGGEMIGEALCVFGMLARIRRYSQGHTRSEPTKLGGPIADGAVTRE